MARRWQIIKKMRDGSVHRATTNLDQGCEEIIKIAQSDPECLWIIVKDRHLRTRTRVWHQDRPPESWWLDV